EPTAPAAAGEARLIARDDRKNPLISTFTWTSDAVPRILRVPAGFMRNQTQERIEELARERGAAVIDLALVEDGIEIGKRMMAEMMATYPSQGKSTAADRPAQVPAAHVPAAPPVVIPDTVDPRHGSTQVAADEAPAGGGYLNEVRSLSASPRQS
ncbi:MAG: hypothetical protein V7647_674, partial [Acidobacteriota bacterium]